MAGTLLHIALAQRSLDETRLETPYDHEAKTHVQDFRLGSVLADLPYYERLWLTGLRTALGLEIQYSKWGTDLHSGSPTELALALLDRAKTPHARALALGFLTHVAVDVVFHADIERRVVESNSGAMGPGQAHKLIEDEMDLHIHNNLLGHPGIGTPYVRRTLTIRPGRGWAELTSQAVEAAHGTHHTPNQFKNCLHSLAVFGLFFSVGSAPWIKTTRTSDDLKKPALRLAKESILLASNYMEVGGRYLNGRITREDFIEAIPPRSLANGEPL